jgi:two-component system, LytTR family, response regulator
MITAIIVDDELASRALIQSLIKTQSVEVKVIGIFSNIDDAVNNITGSGPDVLFLDVALPGGTSFDILERIPGITSHIVFITAHEQYSLKAIKHNAFDYLLKPIDVDEFRDTLARVIKKTMQNKSIGDPISYRNQAAKKISLPDKNGYKYYLIDDLILLEADGSYTKAYLTGGRIIIICKGLKEFELILNDNEFLRVHKSYLINLQHIAELRREEGVHLIMTNGFNVPISLKNRDFILNTLKSAFPHI